MALFRQNLNSGMNFLRRHFSSDDLYKDRDDGGQTGGGSSATANDWSYRMNLPGHRKPPPLPTGPSFPSLSSVQDMTRGLLSQAAAAASSVSDAVSSVTGGVGGGSSSSAAAAPGVTPPQPRRLVENNRDRCKILLIIDDNHNEWSGHFAQTTVSLFLSLSLSLSLSIVSVSVFSSRNANIRNKSDKSCKRPAVRESRSDLVCNRSTLLSRRTESREQMSVTVHPTQCYEFHLYPLIDIAKRRRVNSR